MVEKESEKISKKNEKTLKALKRKGKVLGRPSGKYTTKENFIYTLELTNNGLSIDKASARTLIPRSTFKLWLKNYKQEYGIYNNEKILELFKKEGNSSNEKHN